MSRAIYLVAIMVAFLISVETGWAAQECRGDGHWRGLSTSGLYGRPRLQNVTIFRSMWFAKGKISDAAAHIVMKEAIDDCGSRDRGVFPRPAIRPMGRCGGKRSWIYDITSWDWLQPFAASIFLNRQIGPIINRRRFDDAILLSEGYTEGRLLSGIRQNQREMNDLVFFQRQTWQNSNWRNPSALALLSNGFCSLQCNDGYDGQKQSSKCENDGRPSGQVIRASLPENGDWPVEFLPPIHWIWWVWCLVFFSIGLYGGAVAIAFLIQRRLPLVLAGLLLFILSACLVEWALHHAILHNETTTASIKFLPEPRHPNPKLQEQLETTLLGMIPSRAYS